MSSNRNEAIEAKLMQMEPAESMPDFRVVWDRFMETGGMVAAKKRFEWKSLFYKLIPVPVLAFAIAMIVFLMPFGLGPFTTEGEWFNRTDHYIKVNWKGHQAAISPGGHIRLSYPDKANRSVRVVVYSGKILFRTLSLKQGERFNVLLSDAEVSVEGTVFSVLSDERLRRVSVAKGKADVRFNRGSRTEEIGEGRSLEWFDSASGKSRSVDGEDLSDISVKMKPGDLHIKKWSIGLTRAKTLSVSGGENESLWVSEGSKLWRLNGSVGASVLFRESNAINLSRPSVFGDRVLTANALGGAWIIWDTGVKNKMIPSAPSFRDLASPELFGKYAVCPTLDAFLWVYDTESGKQRMIEAPEGDTIFGSPYVDTKKDRLYYSTGSGKVYEYDLKSGKNTAEIEVFQNRIVFPVIRAGDYLILFDRTSGSVACLTPDQLRLKAAVRQSALSGMDNLPVTIGKKVYWYNSSDGKGKLFMTDAESPTPDCKWIGALGSSITGVCGYGDKLFVSTSGGKVYYYSRGGFMQNPGFNGRMIGADKNGVYLLDQDYIHYFSYEAFGFKTL